MKIKRFSSIDFRRDHSSLIYSGPNLVLSPSSNSTYESVISQYIEPIRNKPKDFQVYDIEFLDNKVGNLHVRRVDRNTLSLEWIDIEKQHRGHKYATQVISTWIDIAKREGYKRMILEVPGNAPDAKHIYEKLGFRMTGDIREEHNKSWNGLSKMVLEL